MKARANFGRIESLSVVMPGLDPGIHETDQRVQTKIVCHPGNSSWIAGSSPAMTLNVWFDASGTCSSAADLKFLQQLRQARLGTSHRKRHQNHRVASAPLLPKFVPGALRRITNFGSGALVGWHTPVEGSGGARHLLLSSWSTDC